MADEPEKAKGSWWMAKDPSRQLQGEIKHGSTVGAVVDVFGAFMDDSNPAQLRQRFTLHGLTIRGQPVSLFDAAVTKSQMHIPGGRSSIVSSVFGVVGGHYDGPDDIRFSKVRVTLTGLRNWTWTSGIETKTEDAGGRRIYTHSIPDDVSLGTFNGIVASLQFTATTNPGAGSLNIQEGCDLVLRADSLVQYQEFEDVLYTFQKFLSLALQRPVYATKIIGHTDQPKQIIGEHKLYQDHVIIRKLSVKTWDRDELIPHDMLFTLGELGRPAAEVFGKFYTERERLKPSLDLYLSTRYNPTQVVRAEFLTLAQALEGYHRVSMIGAYATDDEYAPIKQSLIAAIPAFVSKEFRESLRNRFRYLHEFSLRKRIEALAERHSAAVGHLLGQSRKFASEVSDIRNALTHPAPGQSDEQPDGVAIWHLSEKIALLLETCLLHELGFSVEQVRNILNSRSERARHVHYGSF